MPGPSFTAQNPKNVGLFVPTTEVWDQAQLVNLNINSEEFRLLFVRLYQNVANIAHVLNLKDSALYDTQEFVNGQKFFSTTPMQPQALRNDFRLVMNIGTLPIGVKPVNHNLLITNPAPPPNTTWTFTRIYGVASDNVGINFYPIPDTTIAISVNATQVVINNTTAINFTSCIVVLEYLKN
jgi:hypothetical protein